MVYRGIHPAKPPSEEAYLYDDSCARQRVRHGAIEAVLQRRIMTPRGPHKPRLAERDSYITQGILLQCRRESRRRGRQIGLPVTAPHRTGHGMADVERTLALFIDFENLALGFQGARGRFDMGRVLSRVVEKGKIVAKKAYADLGR